MPEEYIYRDRDESNAMVGYPEPYNDLDRGEGDERGGYPEPSTGSVSRFFLAVFILLVFLGGIAQALHFEWGMLFTQWVVILLPALWYWKRYGFSQRGLHRLRPLERKYIPTILLLGISAWILNMLVALSLVRFLVSFGYDPIAVLPPPVNLLHLAVYLLVIAFSAGVCEEIFFRGAIMPALEKQGVVPALVFSSFLFAIMHVSFTNLPGTFFLGLLFGVTVIKSGSLLAGMALHMLNNAVAVIFLYMSTLMDLETAINSIDGFLYLALFLVSLAGVRAGLIRLQRQSGVEPLLRGRKSWLPRGWFNWAFVLSFLLFFILAFLEIFLGFNLV